MKRENNGDSGNRQGERGAALVTVILISLLLVTAAAGMLSAVGASAKNNTDALSEAKAYWAAESGLQAAINVLRHQGVTYTEADADPQLATYLIYSDGKVAVNDETSFSLHVEDPDNAAAATTYTTSGVFAASSAGPWESTKYFPSAVAENRMEVTYVPPTGDPVTITHPDSAPFPELGGFRVTRIGTGAPIEPVHFRIDYQMTAPRVDTRSIWGRILMNGSTPEINFTGYTFLVSGAALDLCTNSSCTTSGNITLAIPVAGSETTTVYAKIAPLEPYRLKVVSTGFGPNGATKQFEAILQKNPFGNSAGGSPLQMMGPNANFVPGASANMEIQGGSAPSVGVCDAASLNTVNTAHTNGTMNPPPQMTCNQVPAWMTSPITLDALVNTLRQSAQNTGRYYTNGPGGQGWGDFTSGTGLTFCEGNCSMGGNAQGGGILVVTGTFTTSGNPKFKGLVLVTGPGGMVRNGGGNEVFIGNIVVAPYDPLNLTADWTMTPVYDQGGGPGDLINSSVVVDDAFNGTQALTELMLGIAEK